jgi:hypothetical protein
MLEPFGEQAEPGAAPIDDLDQVGPSASAEYEQVALAAEAGADVDSGFVSSAQDGYRRSDPLSGVELKSGFGAVGAVFDPTETVARPTTILSVLV